MDDSAANIEYQVGLILGRPVRLTLTDNVRSMVSFRREGEGFVLRLHRMFRAAPENILEDVALWMKNPGRRPESISRFLKENREHVRPPKPKKTVLEELQPQGRHHDLARIFAAVNAEYFDSRLEMRITWGRKWNKRHPRHLRLGSYNAASGVINISPRLDRRDVPQYFVEYVVYHEMLHAHLGIEQTPDGRRRMHTPEFRHQERKFSQFSRAEAFEKRFFG